MASSNTAQQQQQQQQQHPFRVVEERVEDIAVGDLLGQCKWFSDRLGYGFITVSVPPPRGVEGVERGTDVFVHHSGIRPLNSIYKTLFKGEYVSFSVTRSENGLLQATNVTGVAGGSLMCDVVPTCRVVSPPSLPPVTLLRRHP